MKTPKSTKKLIKKLENIKEHLNYFMSENEPNWTEINKDFKELENYLVEQAVSTKLHNARFKKKLDMVSNIAAKHCGQTIEQG